MAQPVKYQGVDKESSGYKLLAAMGWQEGSGLGARQQGIKEHVKVKKKHDVTGVGALEAVAKARDWTAGMAAYDLVLAKMKPMSTVSDDATRQSEPKVKSRKRKQPEATEEVVTVAAAPLPAKDKSSKKKTKKPKQQLNTAVITETPLSSPAAKMSKPKATVTAAATKVVPAAIAAAQQAKGRHVGRYHRVTAAKKAKGYSSSDLAAILGVESMPAAVPAAVSAAATASPSSAQESSEDTQYQPDEPAATSADASSDQDVQQAESKVQQTMEQDEEPASTEKQWWHGMFVKAGRMGNMAAEVLQHGPDKEVKINGFSEQDQENLYMATHLGKTSGKKGLGKSTQPKDIGGVKWAGKKTMLGDVDAQDASDTVDVPQIAAVDPMLSAQPAEARQNTATEPLDNVEAGSSGLKWKKKAKQLLHTAPAGKMKVKKLQKQLLEQSQCPKAAWDRLSTEMMAQIAASKQFELTKSSIALV